MNLNLIITSITFAHIVVARGRDCGFNTPPTQYRCRQALVLMVKLMNGIPIVLIRVGKVKSEQSNTDLKVCVYRC